MPRRALNDEPELLNRQHAISADWTEIEEFLGRIPATLAPSPYSVCLVSDRAMRGYNHRFRGKQEATDVLSFPADTQGNSSENCLGDILISVETAQRNADRYHVRLEDEIKVLILHGLLHLQGQDHERDNGEMARQERRWAARLGLSHNLLSRTRPDRNTTRRSSARRAGEQSRQGPK